jgi:hypothetical protein
MLKSLVITACLTASAVACTTSPGTRTEPKAAAVGLDRTCIRDTATRIPLRPSECAGLGRTYSGEDIQHTGATDVGQALRLLDPSVTVNGH